MNGNRTTTTLAVLLACLGLAACGGSSSGTSTTSVTSAAASNTTSSGTTGTATPPGAGRFAAVRACLAKEGITLPKRTPGQRPGPGGFLGSPNGGPQLPKGVTRQKFAAALRKCGGGLGLGRGRFNSPAYRQALTAFAACMRQNGVTLPSPNSSGKGPVFSTKGVNMASAQFKTAEAKCQSILRTAFPRRPAPGGTGGA